ncbi:MAG TPA: FKBP-type peptidyl-prolyl cis-trans isomerase [Aeromonadales bacterium]|nr:FKBP-type peptidyl-prolyl cis-trans isomerase [Aeromonadales bacterium]
MSEPLKPGQRILLHMTLKLDDGSVADSSKVSGKPNLLQLGDGSLSDALEKQLVGLTKGQQKTFRLSANDAFGESIPELIQYIERHQFPAEINLQREQIINFSQPSGDSLPGIIRKIEGQSVKVDFNHPLAGEAVTFEIEVVQIHPPTRAETGQAIIASTVVAE